MRQHSKHVHSAHHHFSISYPVSLSQKLYTIVLGPLAVVALVYFVTVLSPFIAPASGTEVTWNTIIAATGATIIRLSIAYALAVICALPLALLVTYNRTVEELLLPVFDILQSVPILALFPVVVILFVNVGFLNGAAIFILFASMLWSLVFTLVGGLKIIPHDIIDAAHVFGLHGWAFVRRVLLPALVPQFVTGSILAVAQGWNIIIVA
ncbi:MAG TPA: ABC transporter permease subunit, partial [Candidatus Paceibacterota bacterium]|nr:ABC transporter permease subunit [Candidatus Paceibacterota bacterium]